MAKKGGKKGKKKSADGEGAPGISKGDDLDEMSRQFYLLQIRDLEEKLVRYQTKCDQLTLENQEYRQKHSDEKETKEDIVAFLRKVTEEKSDKIYSLNEEILTMQEKADQDQEEFNNKFHKLKLEFQETKDRLKAENAMLHGQLNSLQEFKTRKTELEKEFTDLQSTLDQVKESHRQTLYDLEKKAVVDKDRLKKEMIHRVNQVATEFRRVSNQQMAETTKRTIQENVAVNSQLIKLTDKTKDLMNENESLRSKLLNQSQKLEMAENTESELAKKNLANSKLICLVAEKSGELDRDLTVTQQVLNETRSRVEQYEDEEEERRILLLDHEKIVEEHKKLVRNHEELKVGFHDLKKSFDGLQNLVDSCSIDLTNHLMNPSSNTILPNLLSILSSASTGTVKKTVEKLFDSKQPVTYTKGALGLIPKK